MIATNVLQSRWWFNKVLIEESGINLENFMKDFSVNSAFILIQLEPICICVFDLLDDVLKLMDVYFRYFSSDQEFGIAWREFKSI
ncbi:hypothetical protein Tco_1232694 [Tanacetum coccineum]